MPKIKVIIPAQTIQIEAHIPEQVFEIEAILPPVSPPTPEPIPPPIGDVFDLDEFFKGKSGVVYLPSELNNKWTVIKSDGLIKPSGITALVGKNAFLTFENWTVSPTQLFDLSESEEFGIVGITFVCPENRPIQTGFPDKQVFGWRNDSVKKGFFAYINGPKVEDVERVTYGLARFVYSSNSSERIYLIGQNLHHNGFNFTQAKNNHAGNLWLILKNITIHNPIIEQPQSHFYSPTRIKCRVRVQNGMLQIISDNNLNQVKTWVGFNNGNQRTIVHFDRYAYDVFESEVSGNGTLLNLNRIYEDHISIDSTSFLSSSEYHPGDTVKRFGRIVRKQVDFTRKRNWVYTFEPMQVETKVTLPDGEFDCFMVYKGNAGFSAPALIKDSFFDENDYWGSGIITVSQGYGWTWYNTEFSGYIENFHGLGFFRNSGNGNPTQGLTIRNSFFEKNAPQATSNQDCPVEAVRYIEFLESL